EVDLTNSTNSVIDESTIHTDNTRRLGLIETSPRQVSATSARKPTLFFRRRPLKSASLGKTRSTAVHCSPCLPKPHHGPAATSLAIAAQDASTNIAALPRMRRRRAPCGASSLRKHRPHRPPRPRLRPSALGRRKPINLGRRIPIVASRRGRAVHARSAAAEKYRGSL